MLRRIVSAPALVHARNMCGLLLPCVSFKRHCVPYFLIVALVCLRARVSVCAAQRRIKPIISSKYGTAGSWRAQGLSAANVSSQDEASERQEGNRH